MEYLPGALPGGECCPTRAGRLAARTSLERADTNAEHVVTSGTKGQPIGRIQVNAAPCTDKSAPPLGVAGVDALTACHALDDFDVMMAVIHHEAGCAFLADHALPSVHLLRGLNQGLPCGIMPNLTARYSARHPSLVSERMMILLG